MSSEALYLEMPENVELFFGVLWPDNLMTVSIDDCMDEDSECFDVKINKEQAIQIIKHLQEQFNLPSSPELLEMLTKISLAFEMFNPPSKELALNWAEEINQLITKSTT